MAKVKFMRNMIFEAHDNVKVSKISELQNNWHIFNGKSNVLLVF